MLWEKLFELTYYYFEKFSFNIFRPWLNTKSWSFSK